MKNELVEKFNRHTSIFREINSLKSDALTTDAPTDEHFSYINSLREEIEYLREENRAKTLIIKQLTDIKTTVIATSTLLTMIIFKNKKSTNKNLPNTKTFSTTDNFTSTCFEPPKN